MSLNKVFASSSVPAVYGTGDPYTKPSNEVYIIPFDGAANDRFGISVAVGSGRIVVGAGFDDDNGSSSGSAYIYDLDGNLLSKITASDGAADDTFGLSVAVGSGRIVVGARADDDNGSSSGSAYIFDLAGNQLAKITASDGATSDLFGDPVAVGSGRIVVGAQGNDDNGSSSGSAYIYDLDGNELTKITASDAVAGDGFGRTVAVGNGRIVVGSPFVDTDIGSNIGAVYIFDLEGNELAKISSGEGRDNEYYGAAVAVGSGRIVVGVSRHYENSRIYIGTVYVYDLEGNLVDKIYNEEGNNAYHEFGCSVSIANGRIVGGARGGNGTTSTATGAAYIYETPNIITPYDILDWENG